MNHLYCYKMTWDTEFAPNPYCGVLTLATCKPTIRRCAMIGDWVSGWAARIVHDNDRLAYSFKEGQNLIYLARVTKKIPFEQYWNEYPEKRPKKLNTERSRVAKGCGSGCAGTKVKYDVGDNIYEPSDNGDFIQHENSNHFEWDKLHDLSGKNVLICDEFYYFGVKNALRIEKDLFPFIIPRCKKIALSDASGLIDFITDRYVPGIIKKKQ